jgi:hypothetical protein
MPRVSILEIPKGPIGEWQIHLPLPGNEANDLVAFSGAGREAA